MTRCFVLGCKSNSMKKEPGMSFHKLPRNEKLREKWLQNIGRSLVPASHISICSLHFEEDCFNRTLDVVRLRENSVPTRFPAPGVSSPIVALSSTTYNIELSGEESQQTIGPSLHKETVFSPSSSTHNIQFSQREPQQVPGVSSPRVALSSTTHNIEFSGEESQQATTDVETIKMQKLASKIKTQKKQIKRLREKVRRQAKKIAGFKTIIEDLKNKNYVNEEASTLLEECAGPREFLNRQILKSRGMPLPKKYTEEIRKFALTLHFLSPKAYSFVRKTYNTCLPHPRTLTKWYQHTDAEPGFTAEAFRTLKLKVEASNKPVLCSLVIDEMSIRKGLYWDSSKKKFYGRVDMGISIDTDSLSEASESFVMLLTAINDGWKVPVGYFLITSLSGEQKCELVKKCIEMANEVGVQVVSVTCDGPAANIAMFKELGCDFINNQENTYFQFGGNKVHAFLDPCHAVKLIRNAFGELKSFKDKFDRQIDFKYVELLLLLQENEGLHLGTKLTKSHINFIKQKMKVRLATQLFSNSVADALEFCETELNLKEFKGCGATAYFIRIVNNVFDVLNSHSMRPPGWKKALCAQNINKVELLFKEADDYIRNLKLESGQPLISSKRKTGFLGMLVNMNSAINLFTMLIKEKQVLQYLPLYKVSQDHIELFFSAIRSRGGYNNNPNAVQFKAAYKRLLIRAEIREHGIGNCIPLEQINILNCTSANPMQNINDLTTKKSFVEIEEDDSSLYESYLQYINNADSQYTEYVVVYIAGFITRKLCRSLQCDQCVSFLHGNEQDYQKSLIKIKSRGGLTYPSAGVVKIVKCTEKLLKPQLKNNIKVENYYMYIYHFIMEHFESGDIFTDGTDFEHDASHKQLLIKSIINVYLDIRYKYFGKKMTEKITSRNMLTKLILFRNE